MVVGTLINEIESGRLPFGLIGGIFAAISCVSVGLSIWGLGLLIVACLILGVILVPHAKRPVGALAYLFVFGALFMWLFTNTDAFGSLGG